MAELEFVEEIRIAQFWRKHLGEYEYVARDPEDLRRWYKAMELRGPDEIREYINERSGRHPMGMVTGIVSTAPHPPLAIVELWIASHNKVRTGRYWLSAVLFLVTSYMVATNLQGCVNINPMTAIQQNPPQVGGHLPGPIPGQMPNATATLPQTLVPPATNAAKPTGTGATSPH